MTVCGILGAVALSPDARIDRAALASLLGRLRHRGPDAEGEVAGEDFWLGHRRLAIIDLDARSNQPMADPTASVWLTYNGEIYNFRALRASLERRGHRFRTESDTEVLLAAYREWGIACLEHLNGMFAFALYDTSTRELFLVRDRVGIKPLYYWIGPHLVLFCSEPKGIIGYPDVKRRLNVDAVSAFLSYRHPMGPDTYFEGVCQLEPASYLHVRDGWTRVHRYWRLAPRTGVPPAEARPRLGALIADSVRQMIVSDVPVAALLSGGLDSSIIVHELSRAGAGVACFTATFAEAAYDELPYAREVAERCGVALHPVAVEPADHLDLVTELIRVKDQPLGMHNELAMALLAREVSRHAKVVLCGEGADELFAGYARLSRAPFDHRRARILGRLPRPLRAPALRGVGLSEADAARDQLGFFLSRYTYFPPEDKLGLFTDSTARAVEGDAALTARIRARFEELPDASFFDRIWWTLVSLHLPGLLAMVDATHMAVGLEARVPFLDHRIVQAAFDLPPGQKLAWRSPLHALVAAVRPVAAFSERCDRSKAVLRDLYGQHLPRAVLERRKMGFPVPLAAWLTGPLGATVYARLLGTDARVHALIDRRRLAGWYARHARTPSDAFGKQLWLLLNLELFLQEYF